MKKLLLVLLVALGLQTQAQISPCDSVGYEITPFTGTSLQLNGVFSMIWSFPGGGVLDWSWSVCDANLCYSDTGQSVTFNQFTMNDTVKVCLTTILQTDTMFSPNTYTCTQCDTLVYDWFNGWIILNSMGNPTAIEENPRMIPTDGKIYDLLGRELNEIPVGTMYIRNQKLYITK